MPDHSSVVAALTEGMKEAAAERSDPFGVLVPILTSAIDSNMDAYLLNAAWVEAIACTIARRIPLDRQRTVSNNVIQLLQERFGIHGTI